jgi:hypothetical protein
MPRWRNVSPQPWPDRLVVVLLLRQEITLAEQAPSLTNAELTARLVTLAGWVR